MSQTSTQSAKPGTACLGCRRRKLKCTRENEGCSNCLKSDLPCVYPAPETGVKRKRGPYKKDKPPRERHLEDLVKYLEPKSTQHETSVQSGSVDGGSSLPDDEPQTWPYPSSGQEGSAALHDRQGRTTGNPEDLVKDALVALTRSSMNEVDVENGVSTSHPGNQFSDEFDALGAHPPVRRIFEYWNLFLLRVDPLLKVIHCPSFTKTLLALIDNPRDAGIATETLMFSIYYAAVCTCTPREARKRFGESRAILMKRYGRSIEAALSENYSMPVLESLQALLIYIIAIRREDTSANLRALFSLAVRMAQLMGLDKDPGESYPPFETEMRRRAWWNVCSLESRGGEEAGARANSIMEDTAVKLPSNLFDFDLHPGVVERPQTRTGTTDMTFTLVRFDTMRMLNHLWAIRKNQLALNPNTSAEDIKLRQRKVFHDCRVRIDTEYLQHLHESRPYDWMSIKFVEAISIKARLMISHPLGEIPTNNMPAKDRFELLQASVNIIRLTQLASEDRGMDHWSWYYRNWTQWHSVAIIIAELGYNKNKAFTDNAWAVLDPILSGWDKVYKVKKFEPAWDHVNTLIERARQMRRHNQFSNHADVQNNSGAGAQPTPLDNSVVQTSNAPQQPYPNGFNAMEPIMQSFQPEQWNMQTFSTQPSSNVPFHDGCASTMPGFEGDFGSFADLDTIDFSAFDAVFADMPWAEFSSPSSTDWNMENIN